MYDGNPVQPTRGFLTTVVHDDTDTDQLSGISKTLPKELHLQHVITECLLSYITRNL